MRILPLNLLCAGLMPSGDATPLVTVSASGDPTHPDSEAFEADYVLFITGGTGQALYAPLSSVFLNASGNNSSAEVTLTLPAYSPFAISDRFQTSYNGGHPATALSFTYDVPLVVRVGLYARVSEGYGSASASFDPFHADPNYVFLVSIDQLVGQFGHQEIPNPNAVVSFTLLPEPGTFGLLAIGLGLMSFRQPFYKNKSFSRSFISFSLGL